MTDHDDPTPLYRQLTRQKLAAAVLIQAKAGREHTLQDVRGIEDDEAGIRAYVRGELLQGAREEELEILQTTEYGPRLFKHHEAAIDLFLRAEAVAFDVEGFGKAGAGQRDATGQEAEHEGEEQQGQRRRAHRAPSRAE